MLGFSQMDNAGAWRIAETNRHEVGRVRAGRSRLIAAGIAPGKEDRPAILEIT